MNVYSTGTKDVQYQECLATATGGFVKDINDMIDALHLQPSQLSELVNEDIAEHYKITSVLGGSSLFEF